MTIFRDVNTERAGHWCANAVKYRFAKVFSRKRDKRLWVFSAWEGEKYADNARYLFEYIRQSHPEITCIWQTTDRLVYKSLQDRNIPVQLTGSEEARRTQAKAGVALFTNGIDDFGRKGDVFGAVLVCLWHGFGTKKGFRQLYHQPDPIRREVSNLKWDLFSWVKRDITVVVSEYTRKQFAQMFRIKDPGDILIAGQARYDAFAHETGPEEVFTTREMAERVKGKRIILYMPTFREDSDSMIRQMEAVLNSEEIRSTLKRMNSVLVNKLHYLNRGDLRSTETAIMLNDGDVTDTQALLQISDILITDYSSCAADFSLLKKPIIFFFPDWKERTDDDSLIPETEEICSVNAAKTLQELNRRLTETIGNPARGLEQSERIREFFDDTGIEPGGYAENNYRMIVRRLKEKYHYSEEGKADR